MDNFDSDRLVEIQDNVLDDAHEWLEELPVSEQTRWKIFDGLCIVTGKLLDAIQKEDGLD